jgi:hypothetical protein
VRAAFKDLKMEIQDKAQENFITLENEVKKIKLTLDEVHSAIIGNRLTGDGGMALRLKQAEIDLEDVGKRLNVAEKKQIKYNVYTVIMWVLLGACASMIFAFIVTQFFEIKR